MDFPVTTPQQSSPLEKPSTPLLSWLTRRRYSIEPDTFCFTCSFAVAGLCTVALHLCSPLGHLLLTRLVMLRVLFFSYEPAVLSCWRAGGERQPLGFRCLMLVLFPTEGSPLWLGCAELHRNPTLRMLFIFWEYGLPPTESSWPLTCVGIYDDFEMIKTWESERCGFPVFSSRLLLQLPQWGLEPLPRRLL